MSILASDGNLKQEYCQILAMIAERSVVLATGHISPDESLALIKRATRLGCERIVVAHVSESVTRMSESQKKEAVRLGAYIEHCFFAVPPTCPNPVTLEDIRDQIRAIGVEHCRLSSDFGQTHNLPPVEGFGFYLEKMKKVGFSVDEIRLMVRDNPKAVLEEGR